jgi:hypothetical protein
LYWQAQEVRRKKRKIVEEEDDSEGDSEPGKAEAATDVAEAKSQEANSTIEKEAQTTETGDNMQVEQKDQATTELQEEKDEEGENEEAKALREKTQDAIMQVLTRYLKEELSAADALAQTPKLLRQRVEVALGHSVEEYAGFILQCARKIFTASE